MIRIEAFSEEILDFDINMNFPAHIKPTRNSPVGFKSMIFAVDDEP